MRDRIRPQIDNSARRLSPNPAAHANVLVEWFGVHTALAMARFYATNGPAGEYWSDVLATLTARVPQTAQTESGNPLPRRPSLRSRPRTK